jgi:hypothetical protein
MACVFYNYSPGGSGYLRVLRLIVSTPGCPRLIHYRLTTYVSCPSTVRAALLIHDDAVSEWGYTITRDCLERTSCDLFARTHVKYSKILEREQALRSHPKPVLLQHGAPIPTEFQADTVFLLRRRVLWVIREESSECSPLLVRRLLADGHALSSRDALAPAPSETSIV